MDTQSRTLDLIVIHCTATPNGRWTTIEDVDAWHKQRGFKRSPAAIKALNNHMSAIGYHWLIYTNGARASGRAAAEPGAHALGWNHNSLSICLAGTDAFSAEQWDALADQVRHVATKFKVPVQTPDFSAPRPRGVCGHRDLPGVAKTCPGFDVAAWLASGMQPQKLFEAKK